MKHAEKMIKICQTGLLNYTKKTHFPVFAKNFPSMDEVEIFLPIPWALRVPGMGCYTSKCEKKSKITAP
jgi:hypothetical protein